MVPRLIATIASLTLLWAGHAAAQTDSTSRLGTVHFPTSCNDEAQKRFDQAMAYQHSFWYRASYEAFQDVLTADPSCAIAYWGIAISQMRIPWIPPSPENLAEGWAATQKGKALGAKTERERDYIDAIAAFYTDYETLDHRTRLSSYLAAVERMAQKYPDDEETQIYHALVLNIAASPADKTYANQLKAAEILEEIFARRPDHPGVAHYLIHTYDYPPIAAKGLKAARRYAEIAPDSPHATHMPSHIFTRVGHWQDSIASNTAAAQIAKSNNDSNEQLHFMDYLVYAYLQLGEDRKARGVVDEMKKVTGANPDLFTGPFALAASPARYMVERQDWRGAAELEVQPTRFGFIDAITHFARALGAARAGDPAAAQTDIKRLAELRDALNEQNNTYWAQQVDIQRQIASAWKLYAEARYDEALRALAAAADIEDQTDKHPVTPGPLAPARELLGEMLLAQGRAKEALAAFEATLKKEPNRLLAYYGAARAAETSGELTKARDYYSKVVKLAGDADPARPEAAAAKAFVAQSQ